MRATLLLLLALAGCTSPVIPPTVMSSSATGVEICRHVDDPIQQSQALAERQCALHGRRPSIPFRSGVPCGSWSQSTYVVQFRCE